MALGGLRGRLLAGAALAIISGPALAADLSSGGGSLKDGPISADALALSGYVQATNDYIFRGISQNRRDGALQAGLDATYGMFYAGTFTSGIDFDSKYSATLLNSSQEVDLYAGIKPKVGEVTFDFGVITYNYFGTQVNHAAGNFDPAFIEAKAGASITVLKDLALGGTLYYSPNYSGEMGQSLTVEGTASKPIAKIAGVDVAASGTIGAVTFGDSHPSSTAPAGTDYVYGNLGITGTVGALSLDLRWWDTNLSAYKAPSGADSTYLQPGSAFAGTLKLSF